MGIKGRDISTGMDKNMRKCGCVERIEYYIDRVSEVERTEDG